MKTKKKILILGINGNVGSILTELFQGFQFSIIGVDVNSQNFCPKITNKIDNYLQCDCIKNEIDIQRLINTVEIVVCCLPYYESVCFLKKYLYNISKDTLVIDTAAPKSFIFDLTSHSTIRCGYLSTNPLFGPGVPLEGQKIALISVQQNSLTELFVSLLKEKGITVISTSAQEHDQITSITQAATHAVIIAFGMVVAKHDSEKFHEFSTPVFKEMIKIVKRMSANSTHSYWSIQTRNSNSKFIRNDLIDMLLKIQEDISLDDFQQLMNNFPTNIEN